MRGTLSVFFRTWVVRRLINSPTHSYHRYVINFEGFPLRRKESGHSWFTLTDETQRQQMRKGIVAPDYPYPVANTGQIFCRLLKHVSNLKETKITAIIIVGYGGNLGSAGLAYWPPKSCVTKSL